MLRDERDYLMRMIAMAAAIVAKLRSRLAAGGQPDEIVREARQAQGELLGKDWGLLRALDATSAAQILGDKDKRAAWADLMNVEAEALRASGKANDAAALEARAATIRRDI
jgi:hypothetical protein